jgi:hypothetical protein
MLIYFQTATWSKSYLSDDDTFTPVTILSISGPDPILKACKCN